MKLLAFAATTSRNSINVKLVTHAADVMRADFAPDAEIEVIDLNDYEMPIFSIDREIADGVPAAAKELYARIGAADALLISYAEHNGHYSAAWKNTFDWMSRVGNQVFQGKPMVMMAASPGPSGGSSVLKAATESAPFFGADIRGSVSVSLFGERFDAEAGALTDPDATQELRQSLSALAA